MILKIIPGIIMSLDNILKKVVDIINSGGVIACPTESVYGLLRSR